MDIDYITDKDINRQIEEDYKANVLKLKKEIKENGLQKENEEKLLKLVDYIFNIHDKYSYVNESHYTDNILWGGIQSLTVYPDILHDVIMITGFKEDGLSFFDSTITFKSVIDAISTVIARSIVYKEEIDENGDIVSNAYITEWSKSHHHTQLLLDNFIFIYSILENISTHKKELQHILTQSKYHVTYKKLSEEYLSDSDKAKAIYTGLDEYLKKNQKIQTIHGTIPKEAQQELFSDIQQIMTLEQYNFINPINTILDNTKTGREMFRKDVQDFMKSEQGKAGMKFAVSPKKSKKEANVTLAMDFSNFKTSKYLTREHKAVLIAVSSIIEAGNDKFTLFALYKQIYKREPKHTYQLEELRGTIDDLRKILITLDYTEHMKMNGYSLRDGEFIIRKLNALLVDEVTISINGIKTTAYKLLKNPPTYQYAKDCNQLITIPNKYLETENISNTKQANMIKNYLIERIAEAMGSNSMRPTILYENIYEVYAEAANIESKAMTKQKKDNARNITKNILNEFIKNKFIKDFRETKKTVSGKPSYYSVTFTCGDIHK